PRSFSCQLSCGAVSRFPGSGRGLPRRRNAAEPRSQPCGRSALPAGTSGYSPTEVRSRPGRSIRERAACLASPAPRHRVPLLWPPEIRELTRRFGRLHHGEDELKRTADVFVEKAVQRALPVFSGEPLPDPVCRGFFQPFFKLDEGPSRVVDPSGDDFF